MEVTKLTSFLKGSAQTHTGEARRSRQGWQMRCGTVNQTAYLILLIARSSPLDAATLIVLGRAPCWTAELAH